MRHPIYNTFGIEAKAATYVEYASVTELQDFLGSMYGEKVLHVGGGSNLLFLGDYEGVVLHSAIRGIELVKDQDDEVVVRVGAGEVWDDFVAHAVANGWHGVENLSLIPGEVGASAVQNIGAYGVEAKDAIVEVEAVSLATGELRIFPCEECEYAYRKSIFKTSLRGQYAITHVTYRLSHTFRPQLDYGNIRAQLQTNGVGDFSTLTAQQLRDVIIQIRREKLPDPAVQGNGGSFFMNPVVSREQFEALQALYPQMPHYEVPDGVKIPAGWLIEQCGWKGRALGRAAVHDRQALVLVNLGGASGHDILRLSDTICHDVQTKFGITIHPEVNIIS